MEKFKRNLAELQTKASFYWPNELFNKQAATNIIPLLIQTQEKFISLLDISDSHPMSWKSVLSTNNSIYPNLFLKHLMVLADIGGEILKRLRGKFHSIFPSGKMTYCWRNNKYTYEFQTITSHTCSSLDNKSLYVDGSTINQKRELTGKLEDVIMLILYGGLSIDEIPYIIKERCIIGELIGNKEALEKFIKQRYIWLSRITGGATANTMGQLAQDYAKELLEKHLPKWKFKRNGSIPGISQNSGRSNITFDIVAQSPTNKYVGIEVTFQFTTNSVIERKAGQAKSRYLLMKENQHFIAYIIDGAGNFERISALNTICEFSDCTVGLNSSEIGVLIEFLTSLN